MAFPLPTLVSSGTTWSQFAGASGGLSGLLAAVATAQVATADPTAAPTLAANADAGSTLPSNTYYVKITETNAFGETRPSPLSSGQAVVSGTSHLTVTFPSLKTGNFARNVYVGLASNGSDLKLAATGVTASSLNIAAPLPSNSYAVAPPTANSTAPAFTDAAGNTVNKALDLLRAIKNNNAQMAWDFGRQAVSNFLAGNAVNWQAEMMKINHARAALMAAVQALTEAGTLIDANAGTLHNSTNPIGNAKVVRQWP